MSGGRRILRLLPWILAGTVPGPGGVEILRAQDVVAPRVLGDTVDPGTFQPGQVSVRRVTFEVSEGWTARWPAALPRRGDAEGLGAPSVRRVPTSLGTVVWVLAYPFTGWVAGSGRLPPMSLTLSGPSGHRRLDLGGASFEVEDALPAGRARLRAAPPREPLPETGVPWSALAAFPLALVLVTGVGWWRSGAGNTAPLQAHAGRTTPDPRAVFLNALAEADRRPGASLLAMAWAVRRHPSVVARGARECETTEELVRSVSPTAGQVAAAALRDLLVSADRTRYGGVPAESDDVRRMAGAFREQWDA